MLPDGLVDPLLLAVVVLVALLVGVVVAQGRVLRRVRRAHTAAFAGSDAMQLLDVVRQQADELDALRADLDRLAAAPGADVVALPPPGAGIARMAAVRYDAFPDMGASLSFSLALLDDGLDGIVLTSITGRADSRVYCKPVVDGQSDQSLSDEEMAAIDAAARGERIVWADPPRTSDERSRRTLRRRSA